MEDVKKELDTVVNFLLKKEENRRKEVEMLEEKVEEIEEEAERLEEKVEESENEANFNKKCYQEESAKNSVLSERNRTLENVLSYKNRTLKNEITLRKEIESRKEETQDENHEI